MGKPSTNFIQGETPMNWIVLSLAAVAVILLVQFGIPFATAVMAVWTGDK